MIQKNLNQLLVSAFLFPIKCSRIYCYSMLQKFQKALQCKTKKKFWNIKKSFS